MERNSGPSPSKTGGQLKIMDLAPADVANHDYQGRDARNVIEGEMRQFPAEGKYDKQFNIVRFVE